MGLFNLFRKTAATNRSNTNELKDEKTLAYLRFLEKAKQGDAEAQYQVGVCHFTSSGVECDDEQMVYWLKTAAEQGHAMAQCAIAQCVYTYGAEKDPRLAAYWYEKAAVQGVAEAQCRTGYNYMKGDGVEKDEAKGAEWLKKAAEQGHSFAQSSLGECYENGRGVERDLEKALFWFEKSDGDNSEPSYSTVWARNKLLYETDPDQLDAEVLDQLAVVYNGTCSEEEYKSIFIDTKKRAARKGSADAMDSLGLHYSVGRYLEQDNIKALYWLKKAAEHDPKYKSDYISVFRQTKESEHEAAARLSQADDPDSVSGKTEEVVLKRIKLSGGAVYEGEVKGEQPEGQGKVTWPNGDWYEGLTQQGEFWREGSGGKTLFKPETQFDDGTVFEGEWKDGHPWGHGVYKFPDGDVYKGEIGILGEIWGKGVLTKSNGDVFEGSFVIDPEQGTWRYANGDVFEGSNLAGIPSGKGKYTWANGDYYEGEFFLKGYATGINNCSIEKETPGFGKKTLKSGLVYEGQFFDYEFSGRGTLYFPNGDYYKGEMWQGDITGEGTMYFADGGRYEGEWMNGKANGMGCYTSAAGRVLSGMFIDGELADTGE